MKLSKILILWTSVTAGALCASEAPWFEMSGEKLAQKHPQMTRVLKETGTRVIACDGKTTCFQAPQAANLPEKFTWAVWFRPEVQPGNGTILCKTGYHHMLRVNKRGQFGLIYYLASNKIQYLFPEPLPADQWYFGVLVCDGERLSLYINGEKVGSVENKKTAANVLQDIKDRYTSKREGAKIEEAVFIENVEAKQTNTELEDVLSEKEMVERLCTSGEKETMHKVVAGDTLADIAK